MTQTRIQRWRTGILLTSLILAAGCSGAEGPTVPDGPKGTVSGKVTVDGKSVPEGTAVTFHPDVQAVDGLNSGAVTGPDGAYKLDCPGGDQIPVGTYTVSVVAESEPIDPATIEKVMAEGGVMPEPVSAVPAKYNTERTSGLTFEVKEGDNTYDIELTTE